MWLIAKLKLDCVHVQSFPELPVAAVRYTLPWDQSVRHRNPQHLEPCCQLQPHNTQQHNTYKTQQHKQKCLSSRYQRYFLRGASSHVSQKAVETLWVWQLLETFGITPVHNKCLSEMLRAIFLGERGQWTKPATILASDYASSQLPCQDITSDRQCPSFQLIEVHLPGKHSCH